MTTAFVDFNGTVPEKVRYLRFSTQTEAPTYTL